MVTEDKDIIVLL